MKINIELEKELYKILTTSVKRWSQIVLNPSEKMIKKYPLSPLLKHYIFSNTPLLDDSEFNYSLHTRVHWILRHLEDFPKCEKCGKPITHWNIPCWKDNYKHTCCKECERLMAQESNVKHFKEVYGVENAFQIPAVIANIVEQKPERLKKCYETRKKNKTFKTSKAEDRAYEKLIGIFGNVKTQYSSDLYPFKCDYYIPSKDLYIELNYSWTHGSRKYIETDEFCKEQLRIWKENDYKFKKEGKLYYQNAIYTWTVRDPKKFEAAAENKLNYLVFWTEQEFNTWLMHQIPTISEDTLMIPYNDEHAQREFNFFKNYVAPEKHPKGNSKNYIIKYFQQDQLYKTEKYLWATSKEIRNTLIKNRCQYLKTTPDQLTDMQLLDGFKKSGRHYGYSQFNTLLFNWFITRNNIETCYDPCGGWGHRLLGGLNLKKYIYNDLTLETKNNVDRIIKHFNITNTITYNNDARTFIPSEKFEAMFTCPPYFNIEHYGCGDFKDRKDFDDFLNSLFNLYEKTADCRIFGIVIREDLIGNHLNYIESYNLTIRGSYLSGGIENKMREYLYIFRK